MLQQCSSNIAVTTTSTSARGTRRCSACSAVPSESFSKYTRRSMKILKTRSTTICRRYVRLRIHSSSHWQIATKAACNRVLFWLLSCRQKCASYNSIDSLVDSFVCVGSRLPFSNVRVLVHQSISFSCSSRPSDRRLDWYLMHRIAIRSLFCLFVFSQIEIKLRILFVINAKVTRSKLYTVFYSNW